MNAVKFLEAAPERSLVLESFAELTSPTRWSGNLANIWKSRANAFSELVEYDRYDISNGAKKIHEKLMLMMESQRTQEQQEDRECE
ncbi:hypothetical protein EAN93_02140 [Klebsiella pneumoniae]|nr:hypothetical protein EAN93_02140 [Klebsiella pneumoniae]